MKRMICLLTALCFLLCGGALAETRLYDPVAVVSWNSALLDGWVPSYNVNLPGTLMELSHPEGMVMISALESGGLTPEACLSERLDRAGETLAVSNAQLGQWADPFDGGGHYLAYAYTYPDGDEEHLARSWMASWNGMLIELSADVWGEEAVSLMDAVAAAFIEGGFSVTRCEDAVELTATLSDVIEGEDGRARVQLTTPAENRNDGARFYPLAGGAVVLFPNPDDPAGYCQIQPDMASLVDAILAYEETSDSPAVFRSIIDDGVILYMEYSLIQ